jgi:hypothetical protein
MIDLEAIRNYISLRYITRYEIEIREKKHAYKLALINRKLIR